MKMYLNKSKNYYKLIYVKMSTFNDIIEILYLKHLFDNIENP